MEQPPWHSSGARTCCLCPLWVLESGEQRATRWWVGTTRGRVDAAGQLVCLLQPVPALFRQSSRPSRQGRSQGAWCQLWCWPPCCVGAGLPALRRCPPSPKNPHRGLNRAMQGHRGLCAGRAPSLCQAGLEPAAAAECQLPAAALQWALPGAEICAPAAPRAGKSHGWQDPLGRAGAGQGGLTLSLPLQLG